MDTLTKIKNNEADEENSNKNELDKKNTKSRFSVKRDPKLRMSYVVPEEIYPENIDL
ncbi:MAG: hypothetical protein IPL26_15525 [Leptospiraceae bacterium]|nr:hypothetical protein [Leptospiraceae bacterium]